MGHQAQVVLHQEIAGLQVPLGTPLQVLLLFRRLQRPGKGPAAGQAQGKKQAVEYKIDHRG